MGHSLSPTTLIRAYSQGFFPMAASRDGPIDWYSPDPRAVLPLDAFHVPKTLKRKVRQERLTITSNQAFGQVIHACAQPRVYARQTWINRQITEAFTGLHRLGIAHSIEAWSCPSPPSAGKKSSGSPPLDTHRTRSAAGHGQGEPTVSEQAVTGTGHDNPPGFDGRLVGGLYGVALGGAFFGESMFSRVSDASKICLVHLVDHLRRRGFTLLDAQFHNDHLMQFGLRLIPRHDYLQRLQDAIAQPAVWSPFKATACET